MNLLSIIGVALGLSMDAFAVSVANGFMIKELKFRHVLTIALSFGLFQAIMPVLGWAAGSLFSSFIMQVDHWVAFGLLAFVGGKMIYESQKKEEPGCEEGKKDCTHFPTLLLLSLATSIDALAVGLTFAFLDILIILPVVIIGGITFVVCLAGVYIGEKTGHLFENKFELIGGVIIIGIGIKIVIEHLLKQ
ncbi:MAG: manganese efflux pump [Spirochaetales bacterium]|nr:MAG: manganese efflux pump [Spirochaetales bacterium]